ncbi:sister chromatid cohesion 1 protein 3 isoform X1 [Selaginella moellendorffii]|nr:sister chromatid cohesion 1 protein 3 isoform X1 [Selaginella moellendorffii]|eukprot:XP_002964540.2 sister chromatid cohesion 1 protein 3 isoform X1 [Selaginella moellendorffii]
MQSLPRKGPLGTAWRAAHVERRLARSEISAADIATTVDEILRFPDVPLSLRVSAYLLLGVARIYSRKVVYLLAVSNETWEKIKRLSIKASDASLLETERLCVGYAGNLADLLDPFREEEVVNAVHSNVDLHVALAEHITLQPNVDHFGSYNTELDERFPDGDLPFGFEVEEVISQCQEKENLDEWSGIVDDGVFQPQTPTNDVLADHRERAPYSLLRPTAMRSLASIVDEIADQQMPDAPFQTVIEREKAIRAQDCGYFSEKESELAFAPRTPQKPCTEIRSNVRTRNKRKRLAFDMSTMLSNDLLQNQLRSTKDLLRPRKRADCCYRRMLLMQNMTARDQRLLQLLTGSRLPASNYQLRTYGVLERETEREIAATKKLAGDNLNGEDNLNASINPAVDSVADLPDFDCHFEELVDGRDSQAPDSDVCSGRTRAVALMLERLSKQAPNASLSLEQILTGKTRRVAACMFYDILVLGSKQSLLVKQEVPFGDIIVSASM